MSWLIVYLHVIDISITTVLYTECYWCRWWHFKDQKYE